MVQIVPSGKKKEVTIRYLKIMCPFLSNAFYFKDTVYFKMMSLIGASMDLSSGILKKRSQNIQKNTFHLVSLNFGLRTRCCLEVQNIILKNQTEARSA